MKIKAKIILVFVLMLSLNSVWGFEEDIKVRINMTIDRQETGERIIRLILPEDSFPSSYPLYDVCTLEDDGSVLIEFEFPYQFECNLTIIQWDLGSNITKIINITERNQYLIERKLTECDKIKQANMELSLKVQDYGNKSVMAAKADSLQSSVNSCQKSLTDTSEELQECNEDLDESSKDNIFYIVGGVIAGAGGLYLLKYKKDLPKSPAEAQFPPY